jgi:hypothetical protein
MPSRAGTKGPGTSVTAKVRPPAGSLRFPCFITLALTVTSCNRCSSRPLVYAAVIDGLERKLDPLPLSLPGLATAAGSGRWVAVVRPWAQPLAHKANPGHWWVLGIGEGFRPTLLAEHHHDAEPLPFDPELAVQLLTRFLPESTAPVDPDAPPPF